MTAYQAGYVIWVSLILFFGMVWCIISILRISILRLSDAVDMLRKRNAVFAQDISVLYENYFKLARDVREAQTDLVNLKYGGGDKFTVKAQLSLPACAWCGSRQNLTNACSKHSYYVCPAHIDLSGHCLTCGMEDIFS